jgi:hypothetical protein
VTTAKQAPRRRVSDFGAVDVAARLQLCALPEVLAVRSRHVAALLAFTPTVTRTRECVRIRVAHGPTAYWLAQELAHRDVELVDVDGSGGTVEVRNPQIVLGGYGFREGRWIFGRGPDAALGMCRGAVHAAAYFNGHGMKVVCPSAPMMLTLTAVLSRLGIDATPTGGQPRAAIGRGDVGRALERLGVGEVAGQYRAAVRGAW